ncbi:MAG TPA: HAD-IIB family hydrolase [Stenomitos sp.]
MLATDLDGTLVGDDAALHGFAQWRAAASDRVMVAYVTGRSLPSTLALIRAVGLPEPEFILPGLGSAIHVGPAWRAHRPWQRHLARGWDRDRVRAVAARYPQVVAQPDENQGPFKCSFTLSRDHAETVLTGLSTDFQRNRIPARAVYSSRRGLDLIPAHGGKGNAVRCLARYLGLPLSRVLACGDSGNDRDMLALGCLAAIVANAQPELQDDLPDHVYRAKSAFVGGVMDALEHYGWLTGDLPNRAVGTRGQAPLLPKESR